MTTREEAAAKAYVGTFFDEEQQQPFDRIDRERMTAVLAAADAVMFSDAAVERAARVIFPSYFNEFFNENVSPGDVERAQQDCTNHIRAVIDALKEGQ